MLGFGTTKNSMNQVSAEANGLQNVNSSAKDEELKAFIEKRIDEVEMQVRQFKQANPDFDLEKEMQNKTFAEYLWNKGLSVEDAYLLTHKEEIFNKLRTETASSIAARQGRIVENGAGKSTPVIAKKNPKDLTDAELEEILARVQSGEKISF